MSWAKNIDSKNLQTLQDIGNDVTIGGKRYDTRVIARSLLLLGYGGDTLHTYGSIDEERLKSAGFKPAELKAYGFFDGTEQNGALKYIVNRALPSPEHRNLEEYAGITIKEMAEQIKEFAAQKERQLLTPENIVELSRILEVPSHVLRSSVFFVLKRGAKGKAQAYVENESIPINMDMLDETIRNHVPHVKKRGWADRNGNGNYDIGVV